MTPAQLRITRVTSTAMVALVAAFVAGCAPTHAAEAAALSAANQAIVGAAQTIDATDAAQEAACIAGPVAEAPACIESARRLNSVLVAYDEWRAAWDALQVTWNDTTKTDADVTIAYGRAAKARSSFWLAVATAETAK